MNDTAVTRTAQDAPAEREERGAQERRPPRRHRPNGAGRNLARALAFDPAYLPAKTELCQDLLRLGEEEIEMGISPIPNKLTCTN